MRVQTLRKVGNSYVVTIPKQEVERLGLKAGDPVKVDVQPVEIRPKLRPEIQAVLDDVRDRITPALDYLAK